MNLKDIKIDKEQVIKIGKKAGQLSKVIVMNGIKATAISAATKYITTTFDDGPGAVKKITFDEAVGIKEVEKKPKKKKLFSKKDEAEELIEVLDKDAIEAKAKEELERIKIRDEDMEIVDKK